MSASERTHLNKFWLVFSQAFKWAKICKFKHKQYIKCLQDTQQCFSLLIKNSRSNHPQLESRRERKLSDTWRLEEWIFLVKYTHVHTHRIFMMSGVEDHQSHPCTLVEDPQHKLWLCCLCISCLFLSSPKYIFSIIFAQLCLNPCQSMVWGLLGISLWIIKL